MDKKVLVVTGGARGIGKACAEHALKNGYRIAIIDILYEQALAWTEGIEDAFCVKADLTNKEEVSQAVSQIVAHYGRIDALYNIAGWMAPGRTPVEDFPVEHWTKMMNINVTGTFLASQAVGKEMIREGHGGAIVSIGSISALNPLPGGGAYCPSKAAVQMLSKQLALEWGAYGIRSNVVNPGQILTDMNREFFKNEEIAAARKEATALKRIGTMEDVAKACLFLISDEANYITGESLLVDGGITLGALKVLGRS